MRIAIVGGGFSGLACACHLLLKGVEVHLFEEKSIGAGASGIASGLMHPYAGEQVRRSYQATQAMADTIELLQIAQKYTESIVMDASGIIRQITLEQKKTFEKHKTQYQDVEFIAEDWVKISSGVVVYSQPYLEGLHKACVSLGLKTFIKKILDLGQLEEYDAFILALGVGVFSFPGLENLKLSSVRGQALLCEWPFERLKFPVLGKGHIVPLPGAKTVHLGATYERGVKEERPPCLETALALLVPQARLLFPEWNEISVLGCRAGVRVVRPGYAVPWIEKIGQKGFVLTAMGSRGLLYHAHYAKLLTEMIRP